MNLKGLNIRSSLSTLMIGKLMLVNDASIRDVVTMKKSS
jgi:hypothetical protein